MMFKKFSALFLLLFGFFNLGTMPTITTAANTSQLKPNQMDFLHALKTMEQNSAKIAASKANINSKIHRRNAVKTLGGPNISLSSSWGYYDLHFDVGLDRYKALGLNIIDTVIETKTPSFMKPFIGSSDDFNIATNGNKYDLNLKGHTNRNNAILVWPIYTGGLISAVKKFTDAQVLEADADDLKNYAETHTQLVERYFGSQLLKKVNFLYQDAVKSITSHDKTAQRMLEEGLISKVERLQAKVALEDTKRSAEKANNDSKVAEIALQRLLNAQTAIDPTTAPIVYKNPLQNIAYFTELALDTHPGLALVTAKKQQAEALHDASNSRWKPNVAVIGSHEIKRHKANKMVAINLNWTLWSSVDRNQMNKSSQQKMKQAEFTEQQAKEDIQTLIEKNWRELENTRTAYWALQSNLALATEYLKLRKIGLKEGVNTVEDLIDAELNLTKVKTEQLKAAYDYIIALNQLTTNTGKLGLFEKYLITVDEQVKQLKNK